MKRFLRIAASLGLCAIMFFMLSTVTKAGAIPSGLSDKVSTAIKAPAGVGLSGAKGVVETVAGTSGYEKNPNIIFFAGTLVNWLLGLTGIIFVLLIIYAGYQWMTAQGEEEPVKKAKATITNSVIGLIVILGAYAIYNFVIAVLI